MDLTSSSVTSTTQEAALERFLSLMRSARVKGRSLNRLVLDFGCGCHGWNARRMARHAALVHGVDASLGSIRQPMPNAILYPRLEDLPRSDYELIVALAVFEHIPPFELVALLDRFYQLSDDNATIFGTVPTPSARPVLEFLSFKLGLIDSSQIKDHWVYYDDLWLNEIVSLSRWRVSHYSTFQMGLNSQFVLTKLG